MSYYSIYMVNLQPLTSSFLKTIATPPEQKHAAIGHMVNRMNSYRLNDDIKRTEHQIIEQIITNNDYETSIIKEYKKTRTQRKYK